MPALRSSRASELASNRQVLDPLASKLGGVEGGKYTLQVTPRSDPSHVARNPSANYDIIIRQDIPLIRYCVLAFLMILMFPFFNTILGGVYEGRRWANSDYASED